jgi:hypothetical protein
MPIKAPDQMPDDAVIVAIIYCVEISRSRTSMRMYHWIVIQRGELVVAASVRT